MKGEAVINAWSLREVYFDEDGNPSMHRSPPQPVQEPPSAYKSLVRDMTTIAAREVPRGVPIAEFAMHALADAERREHTTPPLPVQEPVKWSMPQGWWVVESTPDKLNMWPTNEDFLLEKALATPRQRTWVGLTIEDKKEYIAQDFGGSRTDAMDWTEKRLMEKNNG